MVTVTQACRNIDNLTKFVYSKLLITMFGYSVVSRIKHGRYLFATDSLFRNATYLTASTVIMSLLGFLFWIFVAHLYSPSQIGIASALISVTTLVSNLSLLGLNSGIIRFLPESKDQSRDINAAAIIIGGVTLLAAAFYAFIGIHISGHISLLSSTTNKLAFTILMVAVSLNSLTDAVFIARRRGEYHTAGYATLGFVKLVLPLLLVPFGAIGIFGAYIFAVLASLILSYYLMWRGCDYRFFARPNWKILKQTRTYATHNYLGTVLAGLPSQLMPIFIIRNIGASSVAYFSMSWTMANLLYIVPSAAMQSLLAEVSHNPEKRNAYILRSTKLLSIVLIPAVALSIVIAPYMLTIFGIQYRHNAAAIFQIFALSTFFVAVTNVGNTILNIERKTWGIVGTQIVNLVVTFGSAVWLVRYGLHGIGISMLLGSFAASVTYLLLLFRLRRTRKGEQSTIPLAPFPDNHDDVALLLRQYGITEFTYKKLTNGSHNITLLIDHLGDKSVVRVYRSKSISDNKINEEIGFMEYLADHGLPVPQVATNIQGEKLSKLNIDGIEHHYILMEYASGDHPSEYTIPVLSDMAAHQAQIHIGGIKYADTQRVKDQAQQPAHTKTGILAAVLPYGYSHFDFDASNILVKDGQVSSILDFEGMRYGPLIVCMYFTLKSVYEIGHDASLPIAYISLYQRTRKLRRLEKAILAVLLSARFKDLHFLRAAVA